MERARLDEARPTAHSSQGEMAKLIRKLRWIGLEDEARTLQNVARTLPADERGTVSIGPFATD